MADKYLFKNLKIVDPNSIWNGKRVDVFVQDGVIKTIGKDLKKRAIVKEYKSAIVTPGFCDLYVDFCDPGLEYREDIDSGINAALAGGFTTVCTIPSTLPVVQSKSSVEYVINKAKGKGVEVFPLGAISEDLKGSLPTEMYDLKEAGAIGFTDAPHAVKSSGLLLRALQYVKPFDGVIFDMSTDESLANGASVNEGEVSVRMGMKGIPHMAEIVQVKRNIEILRYAGGKLHVYGITTAEGVKLIKNAKKEGLNITASVFMHHLIFTDEDNRTFNSNHKINPPFRTSKDKNALKRGLLDGTIDCICSQHTPLDTDEKKLEFEYATAGLTGLETLYPVVQQAFGKDLSEKQLVEWLVINPRKILGLEIPTLSEKAAGNFTILSKNKEWVYGENRQSKSSNSPLINCNMKGKVEAVLSGRVLKEY